MDENQRIFIREAAMAFAKASVDEADWYVLTINEPTNEHYIAQHKKAEVTAEEALKALDALLLAATTVKMERQVGDPDATGTYEGGVKICVQSSVLCDFHEHTLERWVEYGPWIERK